MARRVRRERARRKPEERCPTFLVVEYMVDWPRFTRVSNSTASVIRNGAGSEWPPMGTVSSAGFMHLVKKAYFLCWVPRDVVSRWEGVTRRGRAKMKVIEEFAPARREEIPIWPPR